MNEKKSVNSLKRQMTAAIAMVLVAGIALASATYAWFVTNNNVKATTSTISAQSNAAYMTIKYDATAVGVDTTEDSATVNNAELYPATYGEQTGSEKGTFMTGYGTDVKTATLKGDLKKVGTNGTPEEAAENKYAVLNNFNISSRGQNLSGLKVAGVTVSTEFDSKIDSALRILIVCGDNWEVWSDAGFKYGKNDEAGTLAETVIAGKDTNVKMYLFYEGSDENIFTNNLGSLTASEKVTVTFTADPANK